MSLKNIKSFPVSFITKLLIWAFVTTIVVFYYCLSLILWPVIITIMCYVISKHQKWDVFKSYTFRQCTEKWDQNPLVLNFGSASVWRHLKVSRYKKMYIVISSFLRLMLVIPRSVISSTFFTPIPVIAHFYFFFLLQKTAKSY